MWNPFKKKATTLIPNYKELAKGLKVDSSRVLDLKIGRAAYARNVSRYKAVSEKCHSIPPELIFALHSREASLSFSTCLHNGDPLPGPTTHVPKGRGPFSSWEEAAIDALLMEKENFPASWTFDEQLLFAEKYNGLGYRTHGIYSPYVFAGTNVYISGKYTSDGHFNQDAIDRQLGVAAILLELQGSNS